MNSTRDKQFEHLIEALLGESRTFKRLWDQHDVRYYRARKQPFRHPLVGDLDLTFEVLESPVDPGLTIVVYMAAPGSPASTASPH